MPGVLIVEAMAQTAAALVAYSFPEDMKDKVVYFMSVDRARFRHPVVPGDHLRVEVKKIRTRGPVWRFEGKAKVGEKVCAEAEYAAMSLKP
jgi:3-hydroxyacyl-[acyl-carrier-protein] dehydratase